MEPNQAAAEALTRFRAASAEQPPPPANNLSSTLAVPLTPQAALASPVSTKTQGTTTGSAFPNLGVSLAFLVSFAESSDLDKPMYQLARPDLTQSDLDAMNSVSLRELAKELRVHHHLHLPRSEELAMYDDVSTPAQEWRGDVSRLATTTAEVGFSLIKPRTRGTGKCYAESIVKPSRPDWVGNPTDFLCHAWQYNFKDFVSALQCEAEERDRHRQEQDLPPIAHERFYWNDIFVENQNFRNKPEGYF